jgi:CheY-like chemotaxis protein
VNGTGEYGDDNATRAAPPAGGMLEQCDHADLSGIKVLVVDDDADARALVKRLLGECNAHVTMAASAEEAIALLKSDLPHVLLSDIGMPAMDGYEFIRLVREQIASSERLPAAALTAFARSEDRRRALLAGYQTHVAKPVEPSELAAVVASLAGRTGPVLKRAADAPSREGEAPSEPFRVTP